MRIILLGAGTVGRWIADNLCRGGHSVTVIDTDPETVRTINAELDVQAVVGNASRSTVLFSAGVCGADMCLAVTGTDEVNLVGASLAKGLGARRVMARVYSPALTDMNTFDYQRHFQIDSLLSLEQLSAFELSRSIRNPDAIPLEHFARGHLEVYEVEVADNAGACGHKLRDLDIGSNVRVGSIAREGRRWLASGEDEIQTGDRVSLIGMPEAALKARQHFHPDRRRHRRQTVLIAGGGETGYHLAHSLPPSEFRVSLLERNDTRALELARLLPEVTVIHANANRRMVLEDEGAGRVDFFVGCTGSDESNIMAGVEARELGAKRVLCVVGRSDYANVVGKLGIDVAVSERDAARRQIFGFLNEGSVISSHDLDDGSIGIYEIEVPPESPVVRRPLCELPFPGRCLIAAIHRDGCVRVPTADDALMEGDVVVALIDQTHRDDIIAQFQTTRR